MYAYLLFFALLILLFISSHKLTQALSTLFYRITKSEKWTVTLLAILFFPGVLIHELAHFLMATLLFVPTGEIEFIPQIHEDRVKLGSVQIGRTDPFRRALIGIAPVMVGGVILISILYYLTTSFQLQTTLDWFILGLSVYAIFELSNTMFSSKRDVEGTVELGVGMAVIGILLYVIGVRIPESVLQYFSSDTMLSFMQQMNYLLLIPLGFNFGLYALMRMLGKK